MSEDRWEEVGGSRLISWNEPTVVEGTFIGVERVTSRYSKDPDGKQDRYTVQLAGGEPVDFYAPAILARKMKDPRVVPGVRIRVEWDGTTEKTESGQPAKRFRVQVAV